MDQIEYEAGTVVSFKLVNGDEVVTKVLLDTKDHFVIESPMTVIPAREGGILLVPSMMSVAPGNEFRLPRRQVMLDNPSAEPVADHYREITTGVKAVRKPGLILG